ncbi:glycerophosphodiester phosphodiesterase family protein [Leucobacter chinensis]|uniref:glycerophosphodiester phosphodiesterase family protein n=1 Tax=Leucobacter chinensis TaxID=2851010 RepID=UPI0020B6FF72|nr:glycerophosphodiester phosphodiesterase family protein [Leucobacter chinensis]
MSMSSLSSSTPIVIGHRGAPGYRPEHTASSYRLSFELGADAVEPDVVATRDGVLVVRHENEISGTTDVADHPKFRDRKTTRVIDGVSHTGWFTEDFTWAELQTLRATERLRKVRSDNLAYEGQEPMLRLAEVLAIVDEVADQRETAPGVVIEVKHATYFASIGISIAELLHRELRLAGWQDRSSQLTIECFELEILEQLQRDGLEATYIFLLETRGAPADEVSALGEEHAKTFEWYRSDEGLDSLRGRVHGISVAKRDLFIYGVLGIAKGINDLVQRAHARDLLVYTWTLRPENSFLMQRFRIGAHPAAWGDWMGEMQEVLLTGVDGIFVDHPDLGVSAVRNRLETP